MSEYMIREDTLIQIADAIRAKRAINKELTPLEMAEEILKITSSDLDLSDVTVNPEDVLTLKVYVDSYGTKRTGTMPNNGDVSQSIDGFTTTSVTIPEGYTSGGTINLTDDIEKALAAL